MFQRLIAKNALALLIGAAMLISNQTHAQGIKPSAFLSEKPEGFFSRLPSTNS
ncbi:hypothetical protein ND16A_3774 [Thalassotalea sp. ND16A]|nr:hypothetical protein ND16A_3774 [Thalassotalea sp. ND16A]